MRILTSEEMRAVDRAAIEELGLPGMVLMENAAVGVVEALARAYPKARSVAVFCGPGNNGGDGLAVARHLAARRYQVWVALATDGRELAGDAAAQLEICRRAGLGPVPLDGDAEIATALESAGREADVVIDALFGTGLTRPLAGLFAHLVEGIDRLSPPRLAVDLPSGLDAGKPEPIGPHVHADLTVTFAAPKIAHVFFPAALAAGEVVVADLGIPGALIERAPGDLWLLEGAEVAAALPARPPVAHKGDFGHALVVGGSPGKSGAVLLAGRGALRAGAGLVTMAAPEAIVPIIETASLETMTASLPAGAGGLEPGAEAALSAALAEKSAWALGPGLGREAGTAELVRRAIHLSSAPLVVDADGLDAFAGAIEAFAERKGETVLTPHVGELARLLGIENREVAGDRLGSARRAARSAASLVVLKGRPTLIADPHGGVFANPTGNPGMATAGTGDVLTGLLCGFLAQGSEPLAAAQLAVYVHGLAGDLAAAETGPASVVAGDLLRFIGRAIRELGGDSPR